MLCFFCFFTCFIGSNLVFAVASMDFTNEPTGKESDAQNDPDEQSNQRNVIEGAIVAQSAGQRLGYG